MTNPYKVIGENLKKLRLKKGWKQIDVAERLDISVPSFSLIENGVTTMKLSRLRQLAEILEVPVQALLVSSVDNAAISGIATAIELEQIIKNRDYEINKVRRMLIVLYEQLEQDNNL